MFKWYLIIINALAFYFMLADKVRARKKKYRYPEPFLLGLAAIGGSLGMLIGMLFAHHKTKKPNFSAGIPVLCFIQIVLLALYLYTAK